MMAKGRGTPKGKGRSKAKGRKAAKAADAPNPLVGFVSGDILSPASIKVRHLGEEIDLKLACTELRGTFERLQMRERSTADMMDLPEEEAAEEFRARIEAPPPPPEDSPIPTDSLANMVALVVLRLLSACNSGGIGGDACRIADVLDSCRLDLHSTPRGWVRFEFLLGVTLGIQSDGVTSWIMRGDQDFGRMLFNYLGEQWKQVFKMGPEELEQREIAAEQLVDAELACKGLKLMLDGYKGKDWRGTGAAAYNFNYKTAARTKRPAEEVAAKAAAAAEKKKKKTTHDEGGAAALEAWLAAHPDPKHAAKGVLQLRVTMGDLERHVVLSGAASLWKLNQFASTAVGLPTGGRPEHHTQKGSCYAGAVLRVTRPDCCNDAIVGSQRSATAVGGKGVGYVDEKKAKVSALFRGTSTGQSLEQSPPDAATTVQLIHPKSPTPVKIELVGIIAHTPAAKRSFRMPHNDCPLPRLVCVNDVSQDTRREIDSINAKWLDDRSAPAVLVSVGTSQASLYRSLINGQQKPLFHDDGSFRNPYPF